MIAPTWSLSEAEMPSSASTGPFISASTDPSAPLRDLTGSGSLSGSRAESKDEAEMPRAFSGPISLRISVTDKCQLKCRYCIPDSCESMANSDQQLSYKEITNVVRTINDSIGLSKVRITGGDPLVRPNIDELVRMIADEGIKDIALTTNAQLLEIMAPKLKQAGLNRVNISLDSINSETFQNLTDGPLEKTLKGIEAAIDCGLTPVKLNMIMLRGVNDTETIEILDYALSRKCEIRFLELMPVSVHDELFNKWFISAEQMRKEMSDKAQLTPLPFKTGSTCRRFNVQTENNSGTTGFISPISEPFCSGCSRLRLTSDGKLIGCLAGRDGTNIRPYLTSTTPHKQNKLLSAIDVAMGQKRSRPHFNTQRHAMTSIGG